MASQILPAVRRLEILAFVDDQTFGSKSVFAEKKVISPASIVEYTPDYILVACRPMEAVAARLQGADVQLVSLDFENLLHERLGDADTLTCAIRSYLRQYPGLEEAFDVPTLLNSPWLQACLGRREIVAPASPPELDRPFFAGGSAFSLTQIHIEPTNLCNYRCFCCSVWKTRRKKGFLSAEALDLIIQRIGLFDGEVVLNYCGEPLLDAGLPYKIGQLRRAWPDATLTFVSTLGEKVGKDFLDSLWREGLNRLDVSFYGHSPEAYQAVHGVRRYDVAKENLFHVLGSEARRNAGGEVRMRSLQLASQYSAGASRCDDPGALFRAEAGAFPGVSFLETHLMSQAGASCVKGVRGTALPCSITWGLFSRTLYITWELDLALCCATTGDEIRLGNLRRNSLEEILKGRVFQDFLHAMWQGNLEAYPFCEQCERDVSGTVEELARIAAWKIANVLKEAPGDGKRFCIVGEPVLVSALSVFYPQHAATCRNGGDPGKSNICRNEMLPEEAWPTASRVTWDDLTTMTAIQGPFHIFIVARNAAQLAYHEHVSTILAEKPGGKSAIILPVLGAGLLQPQDLLHRLAELYDNPAVQGS